MRLDSTPRLFVDDRLVAASSGVVRRIEPCRKLPGPVLEPESPWEGGRVYIYGTVLRDPADGLLHMWYMSRGAPGRRDPRLDRAPAIPNGPGAYDAGCILGVSNTPVVQDDEVWFYYTGITTTHGGALPEKRITIGRAAWSRDRFACLHAREKGTVETVPLECAGETLVVNADAAAGSLRISILAADGRPLPGYAEEDCVPLRADTPGHRVCWKERDHLPLGKPRRLRIHLDGARLYSISAFA